MANFWSGLSSGLSSGLNYGYAAEEAREKRRKRKDEEEQEQAMKDVLADFGRRLRGESAPTTSAETAATKTAPAEAAATTIGMAPTQAPSGNPGLGDIRMASDLMGFQPWTYEKMRLAAHDQPATVMPSGDMPATGLPAGDVRRSGNAVPVTADDVRYANAVRQTPLALNQVRSPGLGTLPKNLGEDPTDIKTDPTAPAPTAPDPTAPTDSANHIDTLPENLDEDLPATEPAAVDESRMDPGIAVSEAASLFDEITRTEDLAHKIRTGVYDPEDLAKLNLDERRMSLPKTAAMLEQKARAAKARLEEFRARSPELYERAKKLRAEHWSVRAGAGLSDALGNSWNRAGDRLGTIWDGVNESKKIVIDPYVEAGKGFVKGFGY